ncbi:MAG TPA: PRC-barrel domain-containing protein [Stellaceae bacterium]|nr:PRC-barrel domain-containing protein [Stellaceae bacterium]
MTARCRVRLHAITLVSSLALLAAPALAQSPGAPAMGGAPPAGGAGVAAKPKPPSPNPLSMEDVSQIKGVAVYGSDNKKIGDIATVLMKPQTKTIDRLVIGEGGVLGIGAHNVALPIGAFSWDSEAGNFKIARTADDLKSMPEWHEQVSEAPSGGSDASAPITNGAPSPAPPESGGR